MTDKYNDSRFSAWLKRSKALRLLEAIDYKLWQHAVDATLNFDDAHSHHDNLQNQFADHITRQFLESLEPQESAKDEWEECYERVDEILAAQKACTCGATEITHCTCASNPIHIPAMGD